MDLSLTILITTHGITIIQTYVGLLRNSTLKEAILASVDTKILVYCASVDVNIHLILTLVQVDLQARNMVLVTACWLNGTVGMI